MRALLISHVVTLYEPILKIMVVLVATERATANNAQKGIYNLKTQR